MSYVDMAGLLSGSTPAEKDVELAGVGTIRIRGLRRVDTFAVRAAGDDVAAMNRTVLAFGMVQPAMTEDQAEQWMRVASSDIVGRVVEAIFDLSGMGKDAQKSGVPAAGSES
jgi:hypothetical protein